MDKIEIRGLQVPCIIGIHEAEREKKQDVIADITLFVDLRKAGKSDKIADTADYRQTEERARKLIAASQFFLVEALAESLAGSCFADTAVQQVTIRIEKPGAPLYAKSICLEITRKRKDYE